MREWKEYTLDKVYDFGSGLSKSADQFGFGHGFVGFKDVFYNYFLPDQLTQLVNSTEKDRVTCSVKAGDVFLTRTSETQEELGMSSVALKDYPNATFNGFTKRLRPKGDVEVVPEYAAYYFRSQLFRGNVTSMSSITTRASLNNEMLSALTIRLPEPTEQRAIGSCLKSLDDKIDLLHRQNKTLEAMAETLFRQWFVEEAEEGLTQRPLSSVANYLNGVACQKYPAKDPVNRLPVLKIKDLRDGLSESSDWATTDIDPKYYVKSGDVIFSWSASLIVKLWDGPKAILNQHLFKVTSEEFPKWFYFMWTKHYVDEFVSIAESHATTFGHIKRGDLDEAIVLVPSPERLHEMTLVMEPLFGKHITNSAQIKSLTALRDTLLPKLMSGEVRVEQQYRVA